MMAASANDRRNLFIGAGNRLGTVQQNIENDVLGLLDAGQAVGVKEVDHGIWLVSFMDYDLGYIDLEEKTLQPLANPFGPKV